MEIRRSFLMMSASLALAGCPAVQQITDNSPPAQTPKLTSLWAAPSATGAFAVVAPENQAFKVFNSGLPLGIPRGAIEVFFTAPWLLALKVDVEGQALQNFADLPANPNPQTVGYYRVDSKTDPDKWHVTIHPGPIVTRSRFATTINIATVSINPNYGGADHESVPLTIELEAKTFRVGIREPVFPACAFLPNFPAMRPGMHVFEKNVGPAMIDFGYNNLNANGTPNSVAPNGWPFPGMRQHSLVMRVGAQTVQGGLHEDFVVTQPGPLELCVNHDKLLLSSGGWEIDLELAE
jgi:hypothetical protein